MAESFYSTAASASISSESPVSTFNRPPPPPPPKPSSHDASRTATPSQMQSHSTTPSQPAIPNRISSQPPPIPPSPSHSQALSLQQQQQQHSQHLHHYQHPHQPHLSQATHENNQSLISRPPPIESGWLPDAIPDKLTAELQSLLHNPELLTAFAHQHPSYIAAVESLNTAIQTNLTSAHQTSQLETQVKHLRDQTAQLLLNHTSLQTQWRRKQSEMDDALSPWGPRAMYQRLISSIGEQEAILRAVHESYLDGGGSDQLDVGADGKATEKEVTEWVKRIREGTTVLEKRREMRARWDEGRVGGWR